MTKFKKFRIGLWYVLLIICGCIFAYSYGEGTNNVSTHWFGCWLLINTIKIVIFATQFKIIKL